MTQVDEKALQAAMGDEIENMPHDFDSLESWVRSFLERYESAKPDPLAFLDKPECVEAVIRAIVEEIHSDATNKKAADAVLLNGAEERGIISEAVIGVRTELAKAAISTIKRIAKEA